MPIHCSLVSRDKALYDGPADMVLIPSITGQLGIMPRHAYLFTELKDGIITIRNGDNEEIFTVSGGFAQVTPERIRILSEKTEHIEEIDEERAEAAIERVKEALERLPKNSPEYQYAVAKMHRSVTRLKAIQKYRK